MLGEYYPLAVTLLAGLCAGITLGALVSTAIRRDEQRDKLEINIHHPISASDARNIAFSIMIYLGAGCIVACIGVLVLYFGGLNPMDHSIGGPFSVAFVIGAVIGKLGRHFLSS